MIASLGRIRLDPLPPVAFLQVVRWLADGQEKGLSRVGLEHRARSGLDYVVRSEDVETGGPLSADLHAPAQPARVGASHA